MILQWASPLPYQVSQFGVNGYFMQLSHVQRKHIGSLQVRNLSHGLRDRHAFQAMSTIRQVDSYRLEFATLWQFLI